MISTSDVRHQSHSPQINLKMSLSFLKHNVLREMHRYAYGQVSCKIPYIRVSTARVVQMTVFWGFTPSGIMRYFRRFEITVSVYSVNILDSGGS